MKCDCFEVIVGIDVAIVVEVCCESPADGADEGEHVIRVVLVDVAVPIEVSAASGVAAGPIAGIRPHDHRDVIDSVGREEAVDRIEDRRSAGRRREARTRSRVLRAKTVRHTVLHRSGIVMHHAQGAVGLPDQHGQNHG